MTHQRARAAISRRPGAARDPIIPRGRLVRLLDDCGARLIVLNAPAGYGKTTLARQWLAAGHRPHLWYTATAASADVALLCREVVDLVRRIKPGAGAQALEVLENSRRPTEVVDALGSLVARDLAAWPEDTWLVIDDYQRLTESPSAEIFVTRLVDESPLRLLATTREHPTWMTARRRLYQEVSEVVAADLAMTEDEASEVLSRVPNRTVVTQLKRLARGWPALLGLASFGFGRTLPHRHLESTLFDYVAEELYDGLPSQLKEDLLRLSLTPKIADHAIAFLFGERGSTVIDDAVERGFLTATTPPELHPLIRQFLHQKLAGDEGALDDAGKLARYLIKSDEFDAAFAIATAFSLSDVVGTLLQEAFRSLLERNRTQTIASWLLAARRLGVDDAVINIIDAELALRAGAFDYADQLAYAVARSGGPPALEGRRLLVAARAAYLKSDEERAMRYLDQALDLNVGPEDAAELAWVRMIVSNELELPDTPELLAKFERCIGSDLNLQVRALTGRVLLAWRFGDLSEVMLDSPSILRLSSHASAIVRSSFYNRSGFALAMAARYAESLALANRQIELAQATKLDFTIPHGLILRACALCGLRRFGAAVRALRDAIAMSQDDSYIMTNVTAIHARVLCVQHRWPEAITLTTRRVSPTVTRSVRGDYLAARALAFACSGEIAEGLERAKQVPAVTDTKEANRLAVAVTAICRMQASEHKAATRSIEQLADSDFLDPIVIAYRSYPPLLDSLHGYLASVPNSNGCWRQDTTLNWRAPSGSR